MSMADSLFKKDTVFLLEDDKEYSAEEILQNIGKRLSKRGYVKESFGNALIEREKKYPTGLKTYPYAVAIPHTDLGHVNIPCISFVRLKKGVDFHEMPNAQIAGKRMKDVVVKDFVDKSHAPVNIKIPLRSASVTHSNTAGLLPAVL